MLGFGRAKYLGVLHAVLHDKIAGIIDYSNNPSKVFIVEIAAKSRTSIRTGRSNNVGCGLDHRAC
jgi:hypothetical protein